MSSKVTHTQQPVSTTNRPRLNQEVKKNLVAYTFLLPWLAGFFIFTLGPIVASAYLVVHQLRPADTAGVEWTVQLPTADHTRQPLCRRR